jgi:hypothetical protein
LLAQLLVRLDSPSLPPYRSEVMTSVFPARRQRSRWFWFVLALFALAQIDVVAVVPFADANAGRSAPAHIEAYGTKAHYAHDEATCAVCVARQLIGRTELPVQVALPAGHVSGAIPSVELHAISLDRFSVATPRAPPAQREL